MNISKIIRQDKEFGAFLECFKAQTLREVPLPIVINGLSGGAADAFRSECIRRNGYELF